MYTSPLENAERFQFIDTVYSCDSGSFSDEAIPAGYLKSLSLHSMRHRTPVIFLNIRRMIDLLLRINEKTLTLALWIYFQDVQYLAFNYVYGLVKIQNTSPTPHVNGTALFTSHCPHHSTDASEINPQNGSKHIFRAIMREACNIYPIVDEHALQVTPPPPRRHRPLCRALLRRPPQSTTHLSLASLPPLRSPMDRNRFRHRTLPTRRALAQGRDRRWPGARRPQRA